MVDDEEEEEAGAGGGGGGGGEAVTTVELCKGGAERAVDDGNVWEYVKLRREALAAQVTASPATRALREGFDEVVPRELLRVFAAPELACLIGGTSELDPAEWRVHTAYDGGYTEHSPQVQWLWRVVASMTARTPEGGVGSEY